MKRSIVAAVLCLGTMFAAPAFAERWVAPVNGTASAMAMADGTVMLKISMPAKEFQMMERGMHRPGDSCTVKDVYPGSPDTMILVCGGG